MSIDSWVFAYGSLTDLCAFLESEKKMSRNLAMMLADQVFKYKDRKHIEDIHIWGDYACAIVRSKQDVRYVEFFTFGNILFNDPS